MKHTRKLAFVDLALVLGLAACAQSPCEQPDVVAFVNQARQSHDLDAIGLTGDVVQETPIDRRAAVCSAWMLRRNPAYQPGSDQPRYLRQRQDFIVVKLAKGYEVRAGRP